MSDEFKVGDAVEISEDGNLWIAATYCESNGACTYPRHHVELNSGRRDSFNHCRRRVSREGGEIMSDEFKAGDAVEVSHTGIIWTPALLSRFYTHGDHPFRTVPTSPTTKPWSDYRYCRRPQTDKAKTATFEFGQRVICPDESPPSRGRYVCWRASRCWHEVLIDGEDTPEPFLTVSPEPVKIVKKMQWWRHKIGQGYCAIEVCPIGLYNYVKIGEPFDQEFEQ